jgi:DNA (cytosine-5)-methyltransferase 1
MEMFRLVDEARPEFLLLENVFNLLRLNRGAAMRTVLHEIEIRGYRWAYRVVDSRGFGLPQRRLRVIILASRGDVAPENLLFQDDVAPTSADSIGPLEPDTLYGFYWTEGKRGVGWAKNAVPTIKGGSGLGIPSPPALFDTSTRCAGTPTIQDAERLQGFPAGWTDVTVDGKPIRVGARWTMVGNAVSVPVATWLGELLATCRETHPDISRVSPFQELKPLPTAGFGGSMGRFSMVASTHVKVPEHSPIGEFLNDPLKPLSTKALNGYVGRARTGTKRFPDDFIESLERQAAA